MSKAILEFNLPEDYIEFTLATRGSDYFRCLSEITEEVRSLRKYNNKLTIQQLEVVEEIEKKLHDLIGNMLLEVS